MVPGCSEFLLLEEDPHLIYIGDSKRRTSLSPAFEISRSVLMWRRDVRVELNR